MYVLITRYHHVIHVVATYDICSYIQITSRYNNILYRYNDILTRLRPTMDVVISRSNVVIKHPSYIVITNNVSV